jgi:prepilin-type N-terminal cleavage/methylation domain-containing protein
MRKTFGRRGFTLPEVLVTVTIVAVLAAVMVPAVLNQIGKGDIPALGGDLGAIRTGITTFAADTRKFPRALTHLSGTTLDAAAVDIDSLAYGADASAAYNGPYLPTAGGAHTLPTGGVIADTIKLEGSSLCLRDNVVAGVGQLLRRWDRRRDLDRLD